jgi:hypothetical protein
MLAKVNKALKAAYPDKEIEVVAGSGYMYFCGMDGENIPSIYVHPRSVNAAYRMKIVMADVAAYFKGKE